MEDWYTAGLKFLLLENYAKGWGKLSDPNLIKAGLAVAVERATNPNSAIELFEMLIKMRVFTWREVETLMNNKVLLIIEQYLAHPGEAQWSPELDLELSYGEDRHSLSWVDINLELKRRQQIWQNYQPLIPSMDAIPVVTPQQLQLIDNSQIKDHFRKSVDGKTTLIDIAEKMGKDPLKVAKNYHTWR